MVLQPHVELILAVVAGIVWLVRLEGRVRHVDEKQRETQNDVADLRTRHETLDSRIVYELASLKESVARIEGYLKAKTED